MRYAIILVMSWLFACVACLPVSIHRASNKTGIWTFTLKTVEKNCEGSIVEREYSDTCSLHFLDEQTVIFIRPDRRDTLLWEIETLNPSINPSRALIRFTYKSGYEHAYYFIMKTEKNKEIWEKTETCFFSSTLFEYDGTIVKN